MNKTNTKKMKNDKTKWTYDPTNKKVEKGVLTSEGFTVDGLTYKGLTYKGLKLFDTKEECVSSEIRDNYELLGMYAPNGINESGLREASVWLVPLVDLLSKNDSNPKESIEQFINLLR